MKKEKSKLKKSVITVIIAGLVVFSFIFFPLSFSKNIRVKKVVNSKSQTVFYITDLNNDKKVNLTDLSISSYRQGK
jgi:poly-D-alanine transfer protein DltD